MNLSKSEPSREAIVPKPEDVTLAINSSQILASYLDKQQDNEAVKILLPGDKDEIALPTSAYNLLIEILKQMAQGNTVKLIPIKPELTTQEAADILNVSRPYLITLLESGEIPYRKVGSRRRVLTQDVLNYKKGIDAKRMQTLDELVAQAQELDMGY